MLLILSLRDEEATPWHAFQSVREPRTDVQGPVTSRLWRKWHDWLLTIHICYPHSAMDQRASSEVCTLCSQLIYYAADVWTILLGDRCYLTKLWKLKFMHIGTMQSEWCLYSSYKLFVVHFTLGLATLAHDTLNPSWVAKLWFRNSVQSWRESYEVFDLTLESTLTRSYPAPPRTSALEKAYFRPHSARTVLAWTTTLMLDTVSCPWSFFWLPFLLHCLNSPLAFCSLSVSRLHVAPILPLSL